MPVQLCRQCRFYVEIFRAVLLHIGCVFQRRFQAVFNLEICREFFDARTVQQPMCGQFLQPVHNARARTQGSRVIRVEQRNSKARPQKNDGPCLADQAAAYNRDLLQWRATDPAVVFR